MEGIEATPDVSSQPGLFMKCILQGPAVTVLVGSRLISAAQATTDKPQSSAAELVVTTAALTPERPGP